MLWHKGPAQLMVLVLDNGDGDNNVGMGGNTHKDWKQLFDVYQDYASRLG